MSLLAVEDLTVKYGPIPALRGLSLSLAEGETLGVVGANGAGKSTLTLAITGVVRPVAGRILFAGQSIVGLAPETIARREIALVPEGRRIFEGLTVLENLQLGLKPGVRGTATQRALDDIFTSFPILAERRRGLATRLSGGEQQQLAIARALLSNPRLIILDEPSLGLAPVMVDKVYEMLVTLKRRGVTLLLVEQNPARIHEVADRVIVLSNGVVQLSGKVGEAFSVEALSVAYLGSDEQEAVS
jgi:branched-chain amino acid transport system ATP-binding protein